MFLMYYWAARSVLSFQYESGVYQVPLRSCCEDEHENDGGLLRRMNTRR